MRDRFRNWDPVGVAMTVFGIGIAWAYAEPNPWYSGLIILGAISLSATIILSTSGDTLNTLATHAAGPFALYERIMDRLRALPRALVPETWASAKTRAHTWGDKFGLYTSTHPKDAADRSSLQQDPWSWPILSLACFLALAYPSLLATLQFAIWKTTAGLGDIALIPEVTSVTAARVALGLLVASLICACLATAKPKGVSEKLSVWLGLAAMGIAFVAVVVAGAVAFAGAVAVAVVVVVAVAVAVAVTVAGAVTVAFAVVVAVTVAGAVAVAVTVAGAVTVAFAVVVAVTVAGAVAFAFAGAFAVTVLLALSWACRNGYGRLGYLAFIALGLAAGTIAAAQPDLSAERIILVTGWILLPLTNALFDWLSYGITIWLLFFASQWISAKLGKPLGPVLAAVLDLLAAAFMFIVLSLALCAVLVLVDARAAEPLFDVPALLLDLRAGVGGTGWIIFMIASTLLPTFLHIMIASFSLGAWVMATSWGQPVSQLDAATDPSYFGQLLWRGTAPVLAAACLIALPGLVIWVLMEHGDSLRVWYVDKVMQAMLLL